MRTNFDKELQGLKDKLLEMGSLSEIALQKAIEALKTQNIALADQVIEGDQKINELEEEIEDLIAKLIASQQPVAGDLRNIMSAVKITTGVERVGDLCVDICKATKMIGEEEHVKPLKDIPIMAEIVQTMIKDALNAYVDENVELAKEMAAMDDQVDKMYGQIIQDLLHKMIEHPEKIEQAIQLAYVARYVERIADYCTNIAEAILYIVKGKRVDLNE